MADRERLRMQQHPHDLHRCSSKSESPDVKDKSLATLLRALQRGSSQQDTSRLLSSATTILTLLANPLNITLLTSQLLLAPAIWQTPSGLQTSLDILRVFHSASRQLFQKHLIPGGPNSSSEPSETVNHTEWIRAVANGADEKSPRWQHLLVLGGLLCGLSGESGHEASLSLYRSLEAAIVAATNSTLLGNQSLDELARGSVCLTLAHVWHVLGPSSRSQIQSDRLLPMLTQQVFESREGLQNGYFLGIADHDIVQSQGQQFSWPSSSPSFFQLQKLSKSPLISCLGSLAQLLALCAETCSDVDVVVAALDEMVTFSRSLAVQWRQNKLSEVDRTEEANYLDEQTLTSTFPAMWHVLQSVVFTSVVVLRSIIGRALHDNSISTGQQVILAKRSLFVLRNLYFVSSRMGHHAFGQYSFVYMAAIDILSSHAAEAESFLTEIRPRLEGKIPEHPHDRALDLFFFNAAEHFTLLLTPTLAETLLSTTRPYLNTGLDSRLIDSFEAAHSLVLSAFACPQNQDLVTRHLPGYVDILLATFPGNLSSRQFRLAVKTLVRIVSPPYSLSWKQPSLASIILEAVLIRFETADETLVADRPHDAPLSDDVVQLSEKAALLITLVDSLPALQLDLLDHWLPTIGEALKKVTDREMNDRCRARLWEVLSNGEMDVPRAEQCVSWWNNRAGRRLVVGQDSRMFHTRMMSGALPESSKL